MRRFKTAYSVLLISLVSIALFAALVGSWLDQSWFGFIVILAGTALFVYCAMQTYYEVDEKNQLLIVRGGMLINETIKINAIRKIEDSNSILSAPAMSFNRLEIGFNKFDSVLISPKDKIGFVKALQAINPEIIYKPRKSK